MKFLIYFILFAIFGFILFNVAEPKAFPVLGNYFAYAPCRTAIRYKIGSVDPRFNLTNAELEQHIEQAASLWSTSYGKPLFVPDEKGNLTIHLVYDRRQQLNEELDALESDLDSKETTLRSKIQTFEKDQASFNTQVRAFNERIAYLNSQGGAPKEEYDKLKAEQQQLQSEADSLNARAKELNVSTQSFNLDVGKLNQTVDTYNTALKGKPEEGLYRSEDNSITIYFVNTEDELIHTIAHELGHARGIDHVNDENAIMFPFTTKTTMLTQADVQALQEVCRERSIFEVLQERIKYLTQRTSETN